LTQKQFSEGSQSTLEHEDSIDELRDRVTVVIPTLNEEQAIGKLIQETKALGYSRIMVVDAYSQDRTVEIVNGFEDVRLIQQHGRGKAGALQTAFLLVDTPYLVVLDGDGSYDPRDIDRFLFPLNKFDFVKGERQAKTTMSRLHRLGNFIITRSFNLLFGTEVPDVCSGFYAFKTEVAKNLNFEKHPLTVEQEMLAQLISAGHAITSVPVTYRKRFGGRSKTHTWRQGFRDLITNIDLARSYNPILLFSVLASLILIPAFILLFYAIYLYFFFHVYHGGYFLASLVLFVLGAQGFTVSTIAVMLRRIERKLNSLGKNN
jgi:glycosyltransferase involved in cell wall biosynthesis